MQGNKKFTKLQRNRTSANSLYVHLVFITKYRRKALNKEALLLLEEAFSRTCGLAGARLLRFMTMFTC